MNWLKPKKLQKLKAKKGWYNCQGDSCRYADLPAFFVPASDRGLDADLRAC